VNVDNVFKVCDQPHPLIVKVAVKACIESKIDDAYAALNELWTAGNLLFFYEFVCLFLVIFGGLGGG